MTKKFGDIFEAIKYLEKNSELLDLQTSSIYQIKRNYIFEAVSGDDDKTLILPKNSVSLKFYRGEDDNYDLRYKCVPGIYRNNPSLIDILVSKLKMIDFELSISDHPRIVDAKSKNLDINFEALAQHYELKTDLLDLSSDLGVATFFATNTYNREENRYKPTKNKIGCLRVYKPDRNNLEDKQFRWIGLQPFRRPTNQFAFGYKLNQTEDFSNKSEKVIFEQKYKNSLKFNLLFHKNGYNELLPLNDHVVKIADYIKKVNKISRKAIEIYCSRNMKIEENILKLLINGGYQVVNSKLFKLSRQQKREIKRKMGDKLYNNIKILVRGCCDHYQED